MASSQEFVEYVTGQFADGLGVTWKKMFGEYGIFSGGKMFGLVCDDRFFIKPTDGGRAYVGDIMEAPPYPGAKPCFVVEDGLEDQEWLSELARITIRELPVPKRRKRR